MRRTIVWALVLAVLGGSLPSAFATTRDVTIVGISSGFDPGALTVTAGDAVRWTNGDDIGHTTTQDGPLALWSSGTLSGGGTFSQTLVAAGTYPYHCNIHPQMRGKVKVPVTVAPASGGSGTVFTATIASTRAPDGFVYDVQRRTGSGRWTLWKDGTTKPRAKFRAHAEGTYAFRARLRRESGGAGKWSPAATVTVTG